MMVDMQPFKRFIGRLCIIHYRDACTNPAKIRVWIGEIIGVHERGLLIEKDLKGRVHALKIDHIERISELKPEKEDGEAEC